MFGPPLGRLGAALVRYPLLRNHEAVLIHGSAKSFKYKGITCWFNRSPSSAVRQQAPVLNRLPSKGTSVLRDQEVQPIRQLRAARPPRPPSGFSKPRSGGSH